MITSALNVKYTIAELLCSLSSCLLYTSFSHCLSQISSPSCGRYVRLHMLPQALRRRFRSHNSEWYYRRRRRTRSGGSLTRFLTVWAIQAYGCLLYTSERQVMPSLLMIKEIEKKTGANYLEEIDRHTKLTEKQELKIKQMTTDIANMIEKDTTVPQGNDGIF